MKLQKPSFQARGVPQNVPVNVKGEEGRHGRCDASPRRRLGRGRAGGLHPSFGSIRLRFCALFGLRGVVVELRPPVQQCFSLLQAERLPDIFLCHAHLGVNLPRARARIIFIRFAAFRYLCVLKCLKTLRRGL